MSEKSEHFVPEAKESVTPDSLLSTSEEEELKETDTKELEKVESPELTAEPPGGSLTFESRGFSPKELKENDGVALDVRTRYENGENNSGSAVFILNKMNLKASARNFQEIYEREQNLPDEEKTFLEQPPTLEELKGESATLLVYDGQEKKYRILNHGAKAEINGVKYTVHNEKKFEIAPVEHTLFANTDLRANRKKQTLEKEMSSSVADSAEKQQEKKMAMIDAIRRASDKGASSNETFPTPGDIEEVLDEEVRSGVKHDTKAAFQYFKNRLKPGEALIYKTAVDEGPQAYEVLSMPEDNRVKVRRADGKVGWISLEDLSDDPSAFIKRDFEQHGDKNILNGKNKAEQQEGRDGERLTNTDKVEIPESFKRYLEQNIPIEDRHVLEEIYVELEEQKGSILQSLESSEHEPGATFSYGEDGPGGPWVISRSKGLKSSTAEFLVDYLHRKVRKSDFSSETRTRSALAGEELHAFWRKKAPTLYLNMMREGHENEDFAEYLKGEHGTLLTVIDGMGGYKGGVLEAVQVIKNEITSSPLLTGKESSDAANIQAKMKEAFDNARRTLHKENEAAPDSDEGYLRRGAVAALAYVKEDGELITGAVGDSRVGVYRQSTGAFEWITPEQAEGSRVKNAIDGIDHANLEADYTNTYGKLAEGDTVIVVSDGVIGDGERDHQPDVWYANHISKALEAGGDVSKKIANSLVEESTKNDDTSIVAYVH